MGNTKTIATRLMPDEIEALTEACQQAGMNRYNFLQEAIRLAVERQGIQWPDIDRNWNKQDKPPNN